jgi:hypothetical protein
MTPESPVHPSSPASSNAPHVGASANGIYIIAERETFRGREFLLAGWGVQAWVPENRFWPVVHHPV